MSKDFLLFKEAAVIAYGKEEEPFQDRDLVKAQFVTELVELLCYPFSAIHVDRAVWIPSLGFHDIDVVAENSAREAMIVAAVEAPREYENKQERTMRLLYLKAASLSSTKRVRFLAYYTRWYSQGILNKRHLVVDYAAYPSYGAWLAAGFPSVGVLPVYTKNKEE